MWQARAARAAPEQAAVATLKFLGYTYHGGEHWEPPLGNKPAWLDAAPVWTDADLRYVHSVLSDVLVDIADWEDKALADAVNEAMSRIERAAPAQVAWMAQASSDHRQLNR
jgi:hypothetical protein